MPPRRALQDITRFCVDFKIATAQPGSKHHRPGWVNTACPFCADSGHHLGYDLSGGYWSCFKCGWHGDIEVAHALARVGWNEAATLVKRYGGRARLQEEKKEAGERARLVDLPLGAGKMKTSHRTYLQKRGFDADVLEEEWGLLGTGPTGDYKFRIIAPIHLGGKLVSYLGRDISGRSLLRYKACPTVLEVLHHKHTLYGLDKAAGHTLVIVEGITDVWRLGPGAVATFGSSWTPEQASIIRRWPRRFIIFDGGEEQAQQRASKLAGAVSAFGGETQIVDIECGDPASLTASEAHDIMRELGITR